MNGADAYDLYIITYTYETWRARAFYNYAFVKKDYFLLGVGWEGGRGREAK